MCYCDMGEIQICDLIWYWILKFQGILPAGFGTREVRDYIAQTSAYVDGGHSDVGRLDMRTTDIGGSDDKQLGQAHHRSEMSAVQTSSSLDMLTTDIGSSNVKQLQAFLSQGTIENEDTTHAATAGIGNQIFQDRATSTITAIAAFGDRPCDLLVYCTYD